MKKTIILCLIILIGYFVRTYKIDNPVADWHSWRQADTAAVARNFYKDGWTLFTPTYDDMSGVAELPLPNPNRYRFVEFPIYNSLAYFGYLLNGGVDEKMARLVSIAFSLGSIIFIYLITKKVFGEWTALLASLLFSILPYSIYYSRVILPEPTLIFFCLGMYYYVEQWIKKPTRNLYILTFFFTSIAFLIKPSAIFYLIPHIYTYYQTEKKWFPIPVRYFYLFGAALLPLLAWRIRISYHPEGIPASNWLFNGNHIRFKPAFWRWIIGDRFGREILGVAGSFLFFFGAFVKPKEKENYSLHMMALGSFLYLNVFATGNVQHDYYQTLIVPTLVIFTARGFVLLLKGLPNLLPRLYTIPLGVLFLTLTIYLTWGEVKGLYQINNYPIVEAGMVADAILPKDANVVAPYGGDTSFLYQTNRHGWAVVGYPTKDLHDVFKVDYYIATAKDAKTKWEMRKYVTLIDTPDYVIVDLTRERPGFDRINDIEP